MKTVRRDLLKRLVEAGQVELVGSYHFDDMTGQEISSKTMPCAIMPDDRQFRKEGIWYLYPSDFTSSCGAAYLADNGTIHLRVHSNCSYDLRLTNGASLNPLPATRKGGKRPENIRMQDFLRANGIEANVKYIAEGSCRGQWRISNLEMPWSLGLAAKLNALGFTDHDGEPLGQFSGNGGFFSVFARGHNELLAEPKLPNAA